MSVIRTKDLTLGYDGHPATHHLDGSFAGGSLTAVMDPNGSGKSTLLKGMMGAIKPLGGKVVLDRFGVRDIAYLPQIAEIDRSFPAVVSDLLAMGPWKRCGLFSAIRGVDHREMASALERVGLSGLERRSIDTLSGGQLQWALFAWVPVQDAPVILLDEPFAAIDERTAVDLTTLISHWHGEGRTVIAVLHDADLVRAAFPQTLLMAREPIAWGETALALTTDNLRRARRMVEAWDEHAPWHEHEHESGHGQHERTR
ncbi:MAG: metal ABC transporter ATP-binding protein [Candidatus Devosia euplotis]|nr:metal ABC transporter ATP-binding protein [Candidatus Devosia euplotis]